MTVVVRTCPRVCCCSRALRRAARASSASCFSSATCRSSATAISIVTETIRVAGRGPRDPPRHPARFPDHLSRTDGTRVEVGFDVQSVTRDGAAETLRHRAAMRNGVRVRIGSADRCSQPRPAQLRHPLPHHAADRLLRRLRRALLERHRHRLDLPDRRGRGAHHAAGARAVQADRVLHRPAGRARPGRHASSSSSRAASCSAPRGRCRRTTASPSRPRWQKGVVDAADRRRSSAGYWLADNLALAVRARSALLARARLLRLAWLRVGRDPATRHHHSAVRPAGGHVGGRGALCRPHGLRRPRLHRRDRRSRRQRPSQAHRQRRHDGPRAPRRRARRCRRRSRRWKHELFSAGSVGPARSSPNHETARQRPRPRWSSASRRPIRASCSATISAGRSAALLLAIVVAVLIAVSFVATRNHDNALAPHRSGMLFPLPFDHGRTAHDRSRLARRRAPAC